MCGARRNTGRSKDRTTRSSKCVGLEETWEDPRTEVRARLKIIPLSQKISGIWGLAKTKQKAVNDCARSNSQTSFFFRRKPFLFFSSLNSSRILYFIVLRALLFASKVPLSGNPQLFHRSKGKICFLS